MISCNSVPYLHSSELSYFRRERNGAQTFLVSDLATEELQMNCVAYQALLLCNGNNSVFDIAQILRNLYSDVPLDKIIADVIEIINRFFSMGIISMKEEIMDHSDQFFEKNSYKCRLVNASEIRYLREKLVALLGDSEHNNIIASTITNLSYYNDMLYLRTRLFKYAEDFILISRSDGDNSSIVGAVGIVSVRSILPLQISFLSIPKDLDPDYFSNFLHSYLIASEKTTYKKIHCQLSFPVSEIPWLQVILEKLGFCLEAELRAERDGIDEFIYSYFD